MQKPIYRERKAHQKVNRTNFEFYKRGTDSLREETTPDEIVLESPEFVLADSTHNFLDLDHKKPDTLFLN